MQDALYFTPTLVRWVHYNSGMGALQGDVILRPLKKA